MLKCFQKITLWTIPIARPIFRIFTKDLHHSYGSGFLKERHLEDIHPLTSVQFEGYTFPAPNNIDSYLEKNSKVVTVQGENQDGTDRHSFDKNNSWRCNHMSRFWPFCQKLYIYIMTGEWVNVTDFEKKHYNLLEGAAYGNLSLVEVKKGWLGALKGYEKIDKKFVQDLRSYVRQMERFETLFEAYKTPDLVIVLGERGKRMDVLEGLGAKQIASNEYADIFELENYSTKIIWTSHPSTRRKTKSFREGVLPALGNSARKLLGLVK
jgi:hypothetical protein